MIDGRPVRLTGTCLLNLLRIMGTGQIDRIVLLTTTPAGYDSSVTAGIIDILQDVVDHLSVRWFFRGLVGAGVKGHRNGIVVAHFFKMRHPPVRIGCITGQAAAQVVIDATAGHAARGNR